MTLSKVLKSDGGAGYTVHCFRSSFRDWCADTGINNDWAESALAHVVPNRVEAAYRRTKFLEQRKNLMDSWCAFAQIAKTFIHKPKSYKLLLRNGTLSIRSNAVSVSYLFQYLTSCQLLAVARSSNRCIWVGSRVNGATSMQLITTNEAT